MPIQFNCPYCTASIRVPDSAGGKRGTCPKCGTKLIVPNVAPPPEASTAQGEGPSISAPAVPSGEPAGFPDIQTEQPRFTENPSVARVVRRRGKRKGLKLLIPILSFSVVLGVLAYWMWEPAAQLSGELTAERVSDFEIPPAPIDKALFDLPAEEADATWEDFRQHSPRGVLSPKGFRLVFEPEPQGLRVIIQKAAATDVFRVKTSQVPAIRQHIQGQAEIILKQQQAEFQAAIKRFLQDWQSARGNDLPFETNAYIDTVGFNRLEGITGFVVVAQVGQHTYRCIHEDDRGDLYFLLPTDTKEFVLTGRALPNGETVFPGRFSVTVSNPSTDPEEIPEEVETPVSDEAKLRPEPSRESTNPPPKTEMRDER